ncbi:RagB/SusD family nutrient uptake outer membrane protein [Rapidithrix thailandica]|uniref:RagB/SusD family nutrient uptake outer membrane protein n=1 Tax=Rapidithrix thailandica TaxID=413964 RepID=A0AAW9RTI8_9BACT
MNKFKIILSLLLLITVSACNDEFLERYPLSELSPQTFFRNEKDLRLYLNSMYSMVPSATGIYNEDVDNIIKTSLSSELTGNRTVPTSGGGWSWGDLRKINYFLENYDKTLKAEEVKPYAAEARFFRAWFYFKKVKRFGDVPWYGKVIESDDLENLTKARDPRTLVMDSVLADIDFAVEHLADVRNSEKVNKWTALALKSRLCLFEGTFRKYHTEFNLPDADKFLEESAKAAEELINNGPYSLYTSEPEKAYLELFAATDAVESEVILARKYSAELQLYHNLNYYTITASYGRPGLEKSLVNSYLMKDGSRFTDIPEYDKMQFYEEVQNRDPRLAQTVRTPGYTRIGNNVTEVPDFGASVTGYQLIKFVTEPSNDSNNRSHNDMPVFRLGEMMLNFAEAKAELGTLTQSDLDISINQLRARVGMPALQLAEANANPDAYMSEQYQQVTGANQGVILEIRRERRIELVMEMFRWDDLMRWKEGHLLTRQYKGMYFPGPGQYDLDQNGTVDLVIYEGEKPTVPGAQLLKLGSEIDLENASGGGLILINPHISKSFNESRDYLFPIPYQELQLNGNLTQNPGWPE